jgi:hypothetical protein
MAAVAFLVGTLNLRGTSAAAFDYAEGCETHLGHRAVILIDEQAEHDPQALARFRHRFPLIAYRGADDIDRALEAERADWVHVLKGDGADKWTSRAARTAVHQVFPAWARDAHGDAYAYVSRWLARACAGQGAPWVPHIVALPPASGDLRAELQIPADALVLGCHGGRESFDLDRARRALLAALQRRRDLYFVGLNLTPFLVHERARFLPGTSELQRKRRFIDSCDAMLHARRRGETFGLAVAEFSLCNRPVLTWGGSHERAHLDMLGEAALVYRGERDLTARLLDLDRRALWRGEWDRYSRDYASAPVMARFDDVFLRNPVDPARLRRAFVGPDEYSLGGAGRYLRRMRRGLRGKQP